MKKTTDEVNIIRIKKGVRVNQSDRVVKETPLTIFLNGKELVTLLCTPKELRALTIGFLYSEGFINKISDISRVGFKKKGVVNVRTKFPVDFNRDFFLKRVLSSGCGKAAIFYSELDAASYAKAKAHFTISSSKLLEMVKELQRLSALYKQTGGVHVAALGNGREILLLKEDIGRHNAVDKVLGQAMIERRILNHCLVLTSGRLTSEIVRKVARRKVPILASPSAPTDISINLAHDLGLTLVGFVRGGRLNIYSHSWRVV